MAWKDKDRDTHLGPGTPEANVVVPDVHFLRDRCANHAVVQTRERNLVHDLSTEEI